MNASYAFFGLEHSPFAHQGDTDQDLCWTAAARAAAAWLHECLARGERQCWITGPSGIGKSALVQLLAAEDHDQQSWRILTPEHYTTEALMAALHAQMPSCSQSGPSLAKTPVGSPVLLLDHAERYPEAALRDCLQWQHEIGQRNVASPFLVLVGLSASDMRLDVPNEVFAAPAAAVYALQPLSLADFSALLEHRLLQAGQAGPGLLPPASRELAYSLSQGIPGISLDLFDMALYLAAFHGRGQITPECIREAASYQSLLPATGVSKPSHPAVCAVIRHHREPSRPKMSRPRCVSTWNLLAGLIAVALGTWWTLLDPRPAPSFLSHVAPPISTQDARIQNEIPVEATPSATQLSPTLSTSVSEVTAARPHPTLSLKKPARSERVGPDEVALLLNQASSGMDRYFVDEELLLHHIAQLPSTAALSKRATESPAKEGGNGLGSGEATKVPRRPTDVVQAAAAGNLAAVHGLLGQGVPANSGDGQGETALMKAAWLGSVEVVSLLLNSGAEVNRQSKIGNTALLFAAIKGHRAVVELLLSRGAAINQADHTGRTPLMAAAWNGHRDVVALLLEQHANPNLTTRDGWTPMMYAALANHREIGLLLLHEGANPGLKNREGLDSLQVAKQQGYGEFASLLGQAKR